MSNTGKQLEQLVKTIEQSLLPKGFRVSGNERVHNDEEVQIAEFDIVISGRVGSTSFKWLIECRDRPADGSAPGNWIEQLVGRRDRFNFDKVTAVSTTGFAQEAIEYAEDKGIELRKVETLTAEDIKDWFLGSHLYLLKSRGKLLHADLHVKENLDQDLKTAIEAKIAKANANEPILISKKDGQIINMIEAWRRVLNQSPQVFKGIELDQKPLLRTIRAHYPDKNDRYQLKTEVGHADIPEIVFRAELSVVTSSIPISNIIQYSSIGGGQPISQTIQFEFELDNKKVELSIHKLNQEEGMLLGVQASLSKIKDVEPK